MVVDEIEVNDAATFFGALNQVWHAANGAISWYRGHSCAGWKLVPLAHRKPPGLEREIALHFRRWANVRYPNCPAFEDVAAWLPLMRHYGLATRLLDWSESPLVAAFFAIMAEEGPGPSAVWALNPGEMNRALTGSPDISILFGTNARVMPLVNHGLGQGERPQLDALAISAPHTDVRMAVQLSEYTIHADRAPLEEHSKAGAFLRKITIPAEARDTFRHDLVVLGLRRRSIFPDLQNLSVELNEYGIRPPAES